MTIATPISAGRRRSKRVDASRAPAERPTQTTGNFASPPVLFIDRHPRCSGRNSHRSGFKVAHLVIFHGITHLDRLAAHFAIFHIGLPLDRGVQYHRNPLTAVRADEEMLHCVKDTVLVAEGWPPRI